MDGISGPDKNNLSKQSPTESVDSSSPETSAVVLEPQSQTKGHESEAPKVETQTSDQVPTEANPLSVIEHDSSAIASSQPFTDVLPPPDPTPPPTVAPKLWHRRLGIALLALGLVAIAAFAFQAFSKNKTAGTGAVLDASTRFSPQTTSLGELSGALGNATPDANVLTVNGQLNVTTGLVLSPTSKPTSPVTGQLYFDKSTNLLGYYNGTGYVYIQGGGNTFVTNKITNDAPTTNTTNVTNVSNVTNVAGNIGLVAPNGTAGDIAMFGSSGTLTNSLLQQTGTTLSTGVGVEQVTLGSTAAASGSVVQGGTGNVTILTGDTTGSSGNINIESGASSSTTAGNISIDTGNGVISGTLIASKDFEDGIDNMGNNIYGDNTTVAESAVEAESGTHSLAATVGSNFFPEWSVGDGVGNPPLIIPAVAGHTYAFSAWVRADTNSDNITASIVWSNDGYGGGGFISQQTFGTVTDISTGWRKVAGVLTAPVGSYALGFDFQAYDAQTVGEVHYFDNLTVTDLSTSSSASAISIGTTNAQVITIGNAGMLAPTNIYGGGVNLNGGNGFINISGANLAEVSGGATYTTTTGALDITAATASTWKIAGAAYTGGDLAIQAGDAGGGGSGNNDGGNLLLQGGIATGTGAGGSVIVQPRTDSANAFIIQSVGGTPLLTADTVGMIVTVKALVVSTNLTVNGHIVTGGLAPAIAANGAACTSPTVTISGTDTTGTITVITGTGCSAPGNLATITFATAFGAAPHVTLTPGSSTSLALGAFVDDATVTTAAFTIGSNTAPSDATTYKWNYFVAQ